MAWEDDLIKWYERHGRDLPWRKTADPYKILVSEFMLQQTQVRRVIPKYESWLESFPDWQALASAPRSQVLRLWSGLGYNNRAVRLHAIAKVLVEEYDGVLPSDEESLKKLPGIGEYTAGAIMAFAYDTPGACVDVNVERILSRLLFSPRKKVGKDSLRKEVLKAQRGRARIVANALMDLGGVCTPRAPSCDECPLFDHCKTRGERPDDAVLRAKRRQSPFKQSNRWYRGRILKALTRGAHDKNSLQEAVGGDATRFEKALSQLEEEGLVVFEDAVRLSDA